MTTMVLTAEEHCEHPHDRLEFVDHVAEDRPLDCQRSKARKNTVMLRSAIGRCADAIGAAANFPHALGSMARCLSRRLAERTVAVEEMIEDH